MSSVPVTGPPADLAVAPATLGGWSDPTADADGRPGTRRSRQRASRAARAAAEEGGDSGGSSAVPSNVGELPQVGGASAGVVNGVSQLRPVPGSLVPAQAPAVAPVIAPAPAEAQAQATPAPLVIATDATSVVGGNPLLLPSPKNSPTGAGAAVAMGGMPSSLMAPAQPVGQAPSQRGGRAGGSLRGGRAGTNVKPAQ